MHLRKLNSYLSFDLNSKLRFYELTKNEIFLLFSIGSYRKEVCAINYSYWKMCSCMLLLKILSLI